MEKSCYSCKGCPSEAIVCVDFDRWQPKVEEKVEKVCTRLEMAQMLFDNPQLKAVDEDGNEVFVREDTNSVKRIMYIKKHVTLTLMYIDGEHWRIIEPEPQKV